VDVIDPFASPEEFHEEYGLDVSSKPNGLYDAIVMAVAHDEYKNLPEEYFRELTNGQGVLVDVKGIYRNKISELAYWSL
jgi:UDP-N-acetyl-D-galactosamine dehydrogenase